MNLLGRLFIVLIFIGSIGLASFSVVLYATHTNWREKANKLEQNLKEKSQELATLQKLKADMEAALTIETNQRAERIIALQKDVLQKTQDIQESETKLDELKQELRVAVATVKASHETAQALRERLDGLSEALYETQNQFVEMSTDLLKEIDKSHGLAIQVTNYQATAAKLAEDYRKTMEVLRINGLSPDPALYPAHPPSGILGAVTEVRLRGMVEISIGSDSGLVKGHQLDVIRNREGRSAYIGKIEVIDTAPDRAVARVMPEFRKGTVQLGDEVTYLEMGSGITDGNVR